MSAEAEIVDADVVEEPQHAETSLAVRTPASTELISAATPAERVAQATAMATELDKVIRAQGMRTKMGRKKIIKPNGSEEWIDSYHINVEAWQTLATLLGLAVVPLEPKPIRDDEGNIKLVDYEVIKEFYPKGTKGNDIRSGVAQVERVERASVQGPEGFTCRCEVFKDGVLVGAGGSRCTRLEESWRNKPDYALEGMAQTRSQGRAIGAAARWIVSLAGYATTPAEEMPPRPPADDDAGTQPVEIASAGQLGNAYAAAGYLMGREPNDAAVTAAVKHACEIGGAYQLSAVKAVQRIAGSVKGLHEAKDSNREGQGEKPAPGSVTAPVLGKGADADINALRAAGCICKDPLGTESHIPEFSEECPITGHPIPF